MGHPTICRECKRKGREEDSSFCHDCNADEQTKRERIKKMEEMNPQSTSEAKGMFIDLMINK